MNFVDPDGAEGVFIDLAIAVLVDAIGGIGEVGMDGRIGVIAVDGGEKAILIAVGGVLTVAVLVDAISAEIFAFWMDGGVLVVAVGATCAWSKRAILVGIGLGCARKRKGKAIFWRGQI